MFYIYKLKLKEIECLKHILCYLFIYTLTSEAADRNKTNWSEVEICCLQNVEHNRDASILHKKIQSLTNEFSFVCSKHADKKKHAIDWQMVPDSERAFAYHTLLTNLFQKYPRIVTPLFSCVLTVHTCRTCTNIRTPSANSSLTSHHPGRYAF